MYKLNRTLKQRKVYAMKSIMFISIPLILLLLFSCGPTEPDKTPTWNLCCTLPDSGIYKDIFFIDANEGWLVEESDQIFHTSNSGKSWELQNSGNRDLVTVHFLDKQYGWAMGLIAAYYTINGGTSWNYVDLFGYLAIWAASTKEIFFIDRENVIAFWSRSSYPLIVTRYTFNVDSARFSLLASSLHFTNFFSSVTNVANKVWFADLANNIYLSTDGGVTWSTAQVEADSCGYISSINDIYFTDEQNGWFCSNTSVYHSDDGGNNWYYKSTLPDSSLNGIYFNKNEGWVMGERAIYYSSDGGDSWQEQYRVDEGEKLVSLSFVNNSNGWVLSESGNVYRYGE
jgi:photosystem II stability/assembly factor-like uncharacterized protein